MEEYSEGKIHKSEPEPGNGNVNTVYFVLNRARRNTRISRTEFVYAMNEHAIANVYALVIGFPEGGGPRADVGEYGDCMGTLQQISALVVGEMWGLRFLNALLSGRMWGLRFCSIERRLGTIDCSLDRWQDGGGEEEGIF